MRLCLCGRKKLERVLRKSMFLRKRFSRRFKVSTIYSSNTLFTDKLNKFIFLWNKGCIDLIWFWFTAELTFPNNYLLALYHSQQIRGDAVYQIDPTKDVEASEAYPYVKYTTVDEYLNQFVWFLKFEEHMRSYDATQNVQ